MCLLPTPPNLDILNVFCDYLLVGFHFYQFFYLEYTYIIGWILHFSILFSLVFHTVENYRFVLYFGDPLSMDRFLRQATFSAKTGEALGKRKHFGHANCISLTRSFTASC